MKVLVLVHPGSACGSANFNLGRTEARAAREGLIREIDGWQGGIFIIDSEFSDEIVEYPGLDRAIAQAISTANDRGLISRRVVGDDPDQVQRITEFVSSLSEQDRTLTEFVVTGAWFDPSDGEGCVGSVHKQLLTLGCKAQVGESAVSLADEDEDEWAEQPSLGRG